MKRVVILLGLMLLPSFARAERPITYAEALRAASETNPTLASARFAVDQSQAAVRGARSIYDPNFRLDGTYNPTSKQEGFFQGFAFTQQSRGWNLSSGLEGSFGTGTSYSLSGTFNRNISTFTSAFAGPSGESIQDAYSTNMMMSVTQALLKGHRFAYNAQNITQAESQLSVTELNLVQASQQVLADTASAYWNWVYQRALASIADEAVQVAAESLRVGEAKVEAGELAPVEVTRLRAAHVQAQSSALDAHHGERQASDRLLLLMGLPSGEAISPATRVGEVEVTRLDVAAAVDVAMAQNPDVLIAEINSETAELAVKNARHGVLPALSATATTGVRAQYETEEETVRALAGLGNSAFPWMAVSSNLSVPLGNRASRSELTSAKAVAAQRQEELGNMRRTVRSQVEEQVRTLTSSQERVRLADARLALALETLKGEESLVEAGRSIYKDLLEARNELARVQGDAVKARIDFRQAQVELMRLQGLLIAD